MGPRSVADQADGTAIEMAGLTKHYREGRALDGLDLSVRTGSVFGFLGRNGAGKTTTLRILLGLARPTAGRAWILGHDVTRATNQVRGLVGYLPDVPGFYPWMTGPEFLRFTGRLFGIDDPVLTDRVEVLLDLAGLVGVRQPIGGYSRGMKQRLGIAQALVNAPRVLLLDEPTSALDPLGRKAVLDMIGGLRGRTTVFFSTHILGDVERVCDRVAIVEAGRVVAQGGVDELTSRRGAGTRLLVQVTDGAEALQQALRAEPWVGDVFVRQAADGPAGGPAVEVVTSDASAGALRLPRVVADLGLGLVRLERVEPSLEDVFVDLVGGRR